MFEIILSFISGIFFGTLTGLTPGIHTNLIATSLISIPILTNLDITQQIIFLVSMSITHTFLNFIPSIFFGAPDADTSLGVLPGHKLLLKGQGHHATKLTLIGSIIAIISLIIIIPIFIFLLPKIYPTIQKMMGFILIWISILIIIKTKNKTSSILIFALAGTLGLSVFNLNIEQPLLPMLTGLFGTSSIIYSIKKSSTPPKQFTKTSLIKKTKTIKPTIATILISPICSLLPGLGSSQAAIISSSIFKKLDQEQFLILLGSINTLVMATSFLTLYLFQKTRTGTASAISQITTINQNTMIIILTTIILTSIIAIPLTIFSSKIFTKIIHKIDYKKISITILIFLTIITFYFTKYQGLLILATSTLLGLTTIELETKRGLLMACILVPTIIYYLPF